MNREELIRKYHDKAEQAEKDYSFSRRMKHEFIKKERTEDVADWREAQYAYAEVMYLAQEIANDLESMKEG